MCDGQPHGHDHHHRHDHEDITRGGADESATFRVVITGKGGVGKTSLTAVLARLLAGQSYRVLALDADPQMNLPYTLGMPRDAVRHLVPLNQNADYVEEKTGARPGSGWGLFFRLNPDVSDVVERFGVTTPDGVHLLVMGTTVQPAAGCLCPENTLLASVANNVSLRQDDAILMDTQAGVEHFGRALAKGFRHAVVVTDPTFNGVQVALHAAHLADAIGIPAIHLVVNRVRNEGDVEKVDRLIAQEGGGPFLTRHAIPYEPMLEQAEPDVFPVLTTPRSPFMDAVSALRDALVERQHEFATCTS